MRFSAVALALFVVPLPALADALIDGARLCTQQFPIAERSQAIPTHLLAAISSTETGRWHKELGLALPWPWTINVEGKGYYFKTKAEAIAQTAAFLRAGRKSIDVGCMQVNLKHHGKAFSSLDQAFDPASNVAYSAKFLRTNYNDLGDWIKATAAYHSRTPWRGAQYLAKIEKNWNRIVGKVQQARARQGSEPMTVAKPKFETAAVAQPPARRMNAIDSTRNVKVIQVKEQPVRNEVLIVKQETQPTIKLADASRVAAEEVIVKGATDGVKRIHIDSRGQSTNSVGGSDAANTKFIFAN